MILKLKLKNIQALLISKLFQKINQLDHLSLHKQEELRLLQLKQLLLKLLLPEHKVLEVEEEENKLFIIFKYYVIIF